MTFAEILQILALILLVLCAFVAIPHFLTLAVSGVLIGTLGVLAERKGVK